MIRYVQGSLLDAPQTCILHGCNNRGVFNAGVARQIRQRYPAAYCAYMDAYKQKGLALGQNIYVPCTERLIINSIVQDGYGRDGRRYISYDALEAALTEAEDHLSRKQFFEVALPRIGAGLGGGDWDVISNIIDKCFKSVTPFVYSIEQAGIIDEAALGRKVSPQQS